MENSMSGSIKVTQIWTVGHNSPNGKRISNTLYILWEIYIHICGHMLAFQT